MKTKFYLKFIVLVTVIFITSASLDAETFSPKSYINQNIGKRIAIYGDTRTNFKAHNAVMTEILKCKPDAVFHTGDLVENGNNKTNWDSFDKVISRLPDTTKVYPVPGNHERESKYYYSMFKYLPNNKKWYHVDINGIRFICIDSNLELRKGSKQYTWLENMLKNNNQKYIIVLMHHPILTTSHHPPYNKAVLSPMFEKYGVSAVYAGHNHNYEKCIKNGIFYITTGGGGAPLYKKKIRKNGMEQYSKVFVSTFHYCVLLKTATGITSIAIDLNGNVIDKFKLPHARKIK